VVSHAPDAAVFAGIVTSVRAAPDTSGERLMRGTLVTLRVLASWSGVRADTTVSVLTPHDADECAVEFLINRIYVVHAGRMAAWPWWTTDACSATWPAPSHGWPSLARQQGLGAPAWLAPAEAGRGASYLAGFEADGADPSGIPVVRSRPAPIYPDSVRAAGVTGTVFLGVLIGVDGVVEQVRVLRSVPGLDAIAIEAVKRWTFEPGKTNGHPVEAWVAVPIRFPFQ